MRNKENKSNIEKVEYVELRKTVKKKRRTRARRKRKEHIENILGSGRGPKEAYKTSQKSIINEMRTISGEIVTNQEDVLKVCADFYKDLYSSQAQNNPTTPKEVSPDDSNAPPFMISEIRKTLQDMKKKKAPGNDQITSDIICLGGDEVIKQVTSIFNEILKNRKIPIEWKEAKMIILHNKRSR